MSFRKPHWQINIRQQLLLECRCMADYALTQGRQVPAAVITAIDVSAAPDTAQADIGGTVAPLPDAAALTAAHQTLVELVKPALPQTLLLLDQERSSGGLWNYLGPIPIIRHMMIASLFSLVSFIGLALSPDVTVGAGDILKSDGLKLLLNLLFFISAAGLGAGFYALYKANGYITQGTFDPAYHASYWIRFWLGIISGLVMSVMISDTALGGVATSGPAATQTSSNFFDPAFMRPMLAMLGGFSADLLFTIMNRLVETVESLFIGSAKELLEKKKQEGEAQLAANMVQHRIEIAAKLVKLQQELGGTVSPDDIQAKLDKLLNDVLPTTGATPGQK